MGHNLSAGFRCELLALAVKPFWVIDYHNHCGRGYATEAASALIHEAFIHSGIEDLSRVVANTFELDTGSQRVLDKLGFCLQRREKPSIDTIASADTSLGSSEVWDGDEYYYGLDRSAFVFV